MLWIVVVQKAKGAVVDGVADYAHVVSIHDAMVKADRLPLGNRFGGFKHAVFQH